jgi:two-component system, OmpR family, response regulator TctD
MNLLLVDDDPELAQWIAPLLAAASFATDHARDADQALVLLGSRRYDAVLLDPHPPGISGTALLTRLRLGARTVPVIVTTASDSIDDKIECLGGGADDYVVKPFDVRELIARLQAVIRRHVTAGSAELTCGPLAYSRESRQFALAGVPLTLRRREHSLLEALMLKRGRTVTKSALMHNVFSRDDDPSADAIDIYIHRLRRHLAATDVEILTLRGLGYVMRCREQAASPSHSI